MLIIVLPSASMRDGNGFKLVLEQNVKELCAAYDHAEKKESAALFDIGFALLSTPSMALESSRWTCPFLQFLAVYSLGEKGSFLDAALVSSPIAQLEYSIKLCVYHEAEKRHRTSGASLYE